MPREPPISYEEFVKQQLNKKIPTEIRILKMSDELMKPNETAVSMYTSESDDELIFTEDEQIYPRVSMVQPTSGSEKGMPGWFFNSMSNESVKEIRCVVLRNSLGRVMFDPDRSKARTLCGSDDRVEPNIRYVPEDMIPMASSCVGCEYEPRGYADSEKKTCVRTMHLYCVDLDTGMPFVLPCKSTSMTPAINFLKPLQFRKKRDGLRLFNYEVKLDNLGGYDDNGNPKAIQKKGNKYFVPRFTLIGINKEANFDEMLKQSMRAKMDETTPDEPAMEEGI